MSKFIKPEFTSVMLNVTDACNLKCRYCFVVKNPHYMPLKVAIDTVNIVANTPNGDFKNINFFGGEPTLMWDQIIVPLVKYTKEAYPQERIHFGITSNGVLLDYDKLQFMKANGMNLLFSIDGDKEVQDYNRPPILGESSFDLIKETIDLVPKFFPETTFRGTLIPQTCNKLFESIMFAAKHNYQNCFFVPNEFEVWTEDDMSNLQTEVRKYTMHFIDCFRQNKYPIDFTPYTKAFSEIIKHNEAIINNYEAVRHIPSCGLGCGVVSINYKGEIFGCQELPSLGIENNLYYLGDIYKGIDADRVEKLSNIYKEGKTVCVETDYCSSCLRKNFCQESHCHANSYLLYKNLNTKSKIRCFWDRLLLTEASLATQVLASNKNEVFGKYFAKQVGRNWEESYDRAK